MTKPFVPAVIKPKKRAHPLESKVETYFKKEIALLGGVSWKFTSPNRRAVTDQVTLIFGRVIFVELKEYGKGLSSKQELFRQAVLNHGGEHVTLSGHDGVDEFLIKLKNDMTWWNKVLYVYRLIVMKFDRGYGYVHVPKKRKKKPSVKKK